MKTNARTEDIRMLVAQKLWIECGLEDFDEAISLSHILYDNTISVSDFLNPTNGSIHVGNDKEHPILITDAEGYVHMEYVFTEILFQRKKLTATLISQQCIRVGNRILDRLCFEVRSTRDEKPRTEDVFFDITAGYK